MEGMVINWQAEGFIALIIGVIVLFDIYLVVKFGRKGTVSYKMMYWSYKFPIIPFAMGVVCAHFFWSQCGH